VRTKVISDKYLRGILEGRHVFLSDQPITFLIIIQKENVSLGHPQLHSLLYRRNSNYISRGNLMFLLTELSPVSTKPAHVHCNTISMLYIKKNAGFSDVN
jgi:hypothetical protein